MTKVKAKRSGKVHPKHNPARRLLAAMVNQAVVDLHGKDDNIVDVIDALSFFLDDDTLELFTLLDATPPKPPGSINAKRDRVIR